MRLFSREATRAVGAMPPHIDAVMRAINSRLALIKEGVRIDTPWERSGVTVAIMGRCVYVMSTSESLVGRLESHYGRYVQREGARELTIVPAA